MRHKHTKRLAITTWVWMLLGGTALALSGFTVLLGFEGTVTPGQGIDVAYEGSFFVLNQDQAVCSVSQSSPTRIAVTADEAYPGGSCTFSVGVANNGEATARLQAVHGGTPAECGASVSPGAGRQVAFTLNFTEAVTFDPSVDGLVWVADGLYDPEACV